MMEKRMEKRDGKREKLIAYALLLLLVCSLLPVIYLGRYNHPTGDDFYYGAETHLVWEQTGSIWEVLQTAARGVAAQYQEWQGTYSAMFLMYLAPNVFHSNAYRWVTFGIVVLLAGGIFVLSKVLLRDFLGSSQAAWLSTASVVTMLCIHTVPSQGETLFWYNGSMYYTGFFAITLIYWGLVLRFLKEGGIGRAVLSVGMAAFLAGGNYLSLLPTILLMCCMTVFCIWRKQLRNAVMTGLNAVTLLAFLGVSAAAPGNAVRQSMLDQASAPKAIAKSLLQGFHYMRAWIGVWWLLGALLLLPVFWASYRELSFRFPLPVPVCGFWYGIFCSMSCPTFYTMNSTGPARAVSIVYYGFMLFTFGALYYGLGWVYFWIKKFRAGKSGAPPKRLFRGIYATVLLLLLWIPIGSGACAGTTLGKAIALFRSGEAAAYEEEYQERMRILADTTVRDVVLEPYVNRPDMLYVGDFAGDAEEPTCRAAARYFGKDSLRVNWSE